MPTENAYSISDILFSLTSSQKTQFFNDICPLCNSQLLPSSITIRKIHTCLCSSCRSIYLFDKELDLVRRLPWDNPQTSPDFYKYNKINSLFMGRCPDCGFNRFIPGAKAGLCVNIQCFHCGSKFNISYVMFHAERI
jgi:Zn-finger nucleic acid-binding protein